MSIVVWHNLCRTIAILALTSVCCSMSAQAGTVDIFPGADIPGVVDASPAGTIYIIHPGLYRLQRQINPKNGDIFDGPCNTRPCTASAEAILSGARLLTSFQQSGSYFIATGQTQQGQVTIPTANCQSAYPGCVYPEDLYFDDKPLVHVTALSAVVPGTWYFDYGNNIIYFADNPAGHKVETSVTPSAFTPGPANSVTVKDLTIEKFAGPVMTGAIGGTWTGLGNSSAGANWTVQNNELRLNHSAGLRINFGWQILNNYIHHNGNLGIAGALGGSLLSNVRIEGNEVAYNNYSHIRPAWGGGGVKVLQTRGIVFRGNNSHNNEGSGFHTDTANYDALYENNTIADNTEQGIFHEVSYAATVRNNKLLRNGYIYPTGTFWLYGANLLSSTSQGVEAYCNTVEVSAQGGNGIDILTQARADGILSTNNYFHHNTVLFQGNSGWTGAARGDSEANFFTLNRFDYNNYYLPDLNRQAIAWNGTLNTFSQFQAAGQDTHGTADTQYTSSIPTVAISSPADGSTVSGIVDVTGTAVDSASVSKVELYVDWALKSTTSGNPFQLVLDTNGISNGKHTIAAMAYNGNGVKSCYGLTVNVTGSSGTGATTLQYQTESLVATGVPDARVFSWSGFSGGQGVIVDASTAGNSITFTLNVPTAGTYNIKTATKKMPFRGIAQLSLNGTNVGPAFDEYSPSTGTLFQEYNLGNMIFSTAGNYQFKFTVTGKNASSTGYTLAFDYITLTKQ